MFVAPDSELTPSPRPGAGGGPGPGGNMTPARASEARSVRLPLALRDMAVAAAGCHCVASLSVTGMRRTIWQPESNIGGYRRIDTEAASGQGELREPATTCQGGRARAAAVAGLHF